MARSKQGRYRIEGYDGDYASRDLLPSYSSGHRIMQRVAKKTDAVKAADAWLDAHPPKVASWQGDRHYPYALIVDERTGGREAAWKPKTGMPGFSPEWVEQYHHLRPKKPARRGNPEVKLKFTLVGSGHWTATHLGHIYEFEGTAARGYRIFRDGERRYPYAVNTLRTATQIASDIAEFDKSKSKTKPKSKKRGSASGSKRKNPSMAQVMRDAMK